jgi:hypothetical protein
VIAGLNNLAASGAFAFVAIKDGTLLCEWYGNGGPANRRADRFDAATLRGVAFEVGLVELLAQ